MTRPLKFIWSLFCATSATVFSVALWSLWLALSLLAAVLLYVVSTDELTVPDFALRRVEKELGDAGLRITFARTSLDPTGRLLVEDIRISLPEYPDPVLTAGSLYVEFNPWWLTVGVFDPRKICIRGARASVPAMLSPSGRSEAIARDVEVTIIPGNKQIDVPQFTARIAGVTVTARGSLSQLRPGGGAPRAGSLAEFVSTQFPNWCRRAIAFSTQLEALEEPALHLELTPSDTRMAFVQASLLAKSLTLNTPYAAVLRGLEASVRLPLLGESAVSSRFEVKVGDVRLPLHGEARDLRGTLEARFQPVNFQFTPHSVHLTIGEVEGHGFSARALSVSLLPQPLPKVEAELVADFLGNPFGLRAKADLSDRTATLYFRGPISPDILTPLSAQLKTEVRNYFDFTALDCREAVAEFGPDWKFQQVRAKVFVQGINAYGVKMDHGHARVELAPGRFYSPEAHGWIGENFASGSYEHDLRSHEFRFLLAGQLRPLGISAWFREWWPNFFNQFDFAAAPPQASVDVAGRWREGWRSSVFVFADSKNPVIRGAAFNRVRTRLFIRPTFFDGLELFATHPTGDARGTFAYTVMPETHAWRRLDLELASTLDPAVAVTIIGAAGERVLSQFKYAHPPTLKLSGQIDGPEAPGGAHQTFQIDARTRGEFRFHGFPLEDVSFNAALRDDEIDLQRVEARFAGGAVSGKARVWGTGEARRVGFDSALSNASLGSVSSAVSQYLAEINNRPAAPPGKYVQEKASVRLDLALSAEGRYADPYSFQGSGNATLQGQEIGEVPLLGLLSELLKFTALRFTSAGANFKLQGSKVDFTEVTLRGANSAIDAHGEYTLDRRQLDFNAKLYPFQQSNNLLKTVVGAVLSPISNVFEVKLTGTIDKPEWAFVIGPTNLLRSLGAGGTEPSTSAPAAEPDSSNSAKAESEASTAPLPPNPNTPTNVPAPVPASPPPPQKAASPPQG